MNVTGTNRFIDLCHKLTELGAELPLRMSSIMYDDIQILDLENDCFPDLAEGKTGFVCLLKYNAYKLTSYSFTM